MRFLITALAALVMAGTAEALGEPTAYGEAQQGSLRVVSGVVVDAKVVELKGTWLDETVSCTLKRKLRVSVSLSYSSTTTPPKSRTAKRSGTFRATNCAEGGPNVGFTLTPRAVKAACPNGSWRPGQYAFNTSTTDVAKRLTAHATLVWLVKKRC